MSVVRRLAAAVTLSLVALGVHAQSIVTVAGGGTLDGQKVSDVPISEPGGVAFDRSGNVYIASRSGGQVLKIDAVTRVVTVVAGNGASGFTGDNGPAVSATLRQPGEIALDASDNLYIADTFNGRIRRVDAKTGIITTYAGGGTPADGGIGDGGQATAAELDAPWGLLIDHGFLYVTEYAYNAHRVRRINMTTGVIDTFAGRNDRSSLGGFSGDGGPAKGAELNTPLGIAADGAGNIYIADSENKRVRRVDTNGIITTYAGGGPQTNTGDGIQATDAYLDLPTVISLDKDGNLLIASSGSIRRVDKTTHVITTAVPGVGLLYGLGTAADGTIYFDWDAIYTVAPGSSDRVLLGGAGKYVGDGLAAKAAILHSPYGLAFDSAGNLFIADSGQNIIRRVSAADHTISTVTGIVGQAYTGTQDGVDARSAVVGFPVDVVFDNAGNLYVADPLNGAVWRVDKTTNLVTRYAGGGSPADGFGDNGPATQANVVPWGLAFDSAGNLFVADRDTFATIPHARIRRIDAVTKTITTIAGSTVGNSGDGGPATSAQMTDPLGVAVDNAGNILVAEYGSGKIRKIDRAGIITTIAGNQPQSDGPLGDEGPALTARMTPLHLGIDRKTGDILVTDFSSHRVRRIDSQGIIHTVAGSASFYYEGAFSGDNGPATDANLSFDYGDVAGVTTTPAGDIYFSDSQNNRVRAVFACVSVAVPQLSGPPNNAANASISPTLSWNAVSGAFRYDVRVDTVSPPQRVIASDVAQTTFTPSLAPGTKYFWSVTAKGDPFCTSVSTAASAVSSFTTAAGCGVGSFDLISPADTAQHVPLNTGLTVTLSWQPAAGAVSYDLFAGPNNPPSLAKSGITSTSANADITKPGTLYWFVVAHSACANQISTSSIRSFTPEFFGFCTGTPNVAIASPASGASGLPSSVDLNWTDSSNVVDSFDVYFGTAADPPLLRSGLDKSARSLTVPFLDLGTTYYWKVVAHPSCSPGDVSTPVASFTTQVACNAPQATQIIFAPASVSAGATYSIIWSVAAGLDVDGGYLVERSASPSFTPILDSQVTSSTAASFIAGAPGTIYHRVRAIPACDPTKSGPPSDAKSVTISNAASNIIFSVQPAAAVTALGDAIEDKRGTFTLENIGATAAQVIVGQSELPGSRPFFSIAEGGAFVTLQPRVPRTFTIQYAGPPNNTAASYQGVIFATAVGSTSQLAVTPYAFVNLKVGGAPAVAPQFTAGDYVAFPPFAGVDDSNRAGLAVSIRNPGTSPMDLAAEVGPDVWLVPESGWNSQPLAPGATRTFNLQTRRAFAPIGSPLPRYTYFTVRTKDGASARLLVQDNDQISITKGRATALDVSLRSFIVPGAAKRLRLTNNGGDSVQVELTFTPSGADGFDATAVQRAVVVVPPNDVVTLVDPVSVLFGGTAGQIEVRIPRERLGLILVSASIPVVSRGEGARIGAPHVIYLPPAAGLSTTITLAETTGFDKAAVRLVSDNGQTITQAVARYGITTVNVSAAARWEIDVDSGGGSVIGVAAIGSLVSESRPLNDRVGATSIARAFWKSNPNANVPSVTTVVPVISGSASAGNAPAYRTAIGLVAQSSAAQFLATFYPSSGSAALARTINVNTGQTTVYNDVMRDLFAVSSPSDGNLFLQGPPNGKVYAVLQQTNGSGSVPASTLPLPTTFSEALTSATSSSQRPLYLDGLEQSVDPGRGTRWMLLLNEVGGAAGIVNVRMYEAGNRTRPIADKDVQINSNQQLKLDTVFGALGLDEADRKKDRTNVELVVTATGGTASVAASAVSIDNQTGETKVYALSPMIGSGNPNINFATPVVTNQPPPGGRHRSVHH